MIFLVPQQLKDDVIEWLAEIRHDSNYRQWFPFYLMSGNRPAIMVRIDSDEDALAFALKFEHEKTK